MQSLRRLREAEMARIAFRDLTGLAGLDETLTDLSDLADGCCQLALDFAVAQQRLKYGNARLADGTLATPVIIGMGKLGGRELNFSSDIDLIFFHTGAGQSDGATVIDNERYFVGIAQTVVKLLSELTQDGFVFRVDLMLRPFGSAGPVSVHFAFAEDYYSQHGRDWERYALIKARPIAGDLAAGAELLERLQPFIYRRYLDFNAIGSLRKLKLMIEEDVARRRQENNVKLGSGGIREVEFVAQSFQLLRGGQEPGLRHSGLRSVLRELADQGHLPAPLSAELDRCYVFLRRVENAMQMYDDRQTHTLPQEPAAQAALCAAMNLPDWAGLSAELSDVQARVHSAFRGVFAEPLALEQNGERAAVVDLVWEDTAPERIDQALASIGFSAEPAAVRRLLQDLRKSHLLRTLSEASRLRLLELLPSLLEDCAAQPHPEAVAERVLRVLLAVAGRSTYLALLRESLTARAQLVQLCAASSWISDLLAGSPALLGSLLDTHVLYAAPSRAEMEAELSRRLEWIDLDDVEAGMDHLRRFRKEMTLRIAACDVAGGLPLVQVSDRLTWLAEVVLSAALDRAAAELRAQYGWAICSDGQQAGFAVIAYGKFGGLELGYGSDLDLVFVHDCDLPDRETAGGPRQTTAGALMIRLGQRLVHWLGTLTPAGRAYEVDLELRPSGRSGLPVVSLSGFDDYQRNQAWTWEHQALTRARFVAGKAELEVAINDIRKAVLTHARDTAKLRADVLDMRAKMLAQLEQRRQGFWDVKQGRGGMIDIEFITQYLILREAPHHPELVRYTDNWRQLEDLAAAGVLPDADKQALISIYRRYRAWAHGRALQQENTLSPLALFADDREQVQALWQRYFAKTDG